METIPTNRLVCPKPKQLARCGRGKKVPKQFRSIGAPTDGFLKQRFLPLFEQRGKLPNQSRTEKDFFKSLSILSQTYGLEERNLESMPYPYNILLAHDYAQKHLQKSAQNIELSIMQDDNGMVKLTTKHSYRTGNTLYYIPVLPLYRLLQDKKQKQTAELLLSVFAYLYHVAGIPYYRENDSYLYYHYECLEEWLFDDLENIEMEQGNREILEFKKAFYYGDVMLRKMYNLHNLNFFRQRIESYKPICSFQKECLAVAEKALELLIRYPNCNIFCNTGNGKFDYDDEIIRAEQYISFISDSDGILHENIIRMVNDEFNECSEIEEPTLLQIYDAENHPLDIGLDFEYRLFPLLNDLCYLLNNMP